jgi:hypothetical protein
MKAFDGYPTEIGGGEKKKKKKKKKVERDAVEQPNSVLIRKQTT